MDEQEKADAAEVKANLAKKALEKALVKRVYNKKDYDPTLTNEDCANKITNLKNELRWKLSSTIQPTGSKVRGGLWR
tara:strand:+ start:120 stop:350 length:231 start_codon:yes stop_codon:yes gene_type:complete